jgi:hypothetical protein
MKVIYYYQTFVGLNQLLTHIEDVDVIIVSSIHFGKTNDKPYIYLNDNEPYDPLFNNLWLQTEKASVQGCKIMLMMGGAGGAYHELFSDFDTYYPLLKQLIIEKSWIRGIDLDIEEGVKLSNVQMLIRRLVKDFGCNFTITMAPVSSSLQNDGGSMGGFDYKILYQSEEGKYIHWFNTQCYDSYSRDTYDSIIKNGYPPEKIVMGMESGQFDDKTFKDALQNIKEIKKEYPNIGGVYDWEYLNAPPDSKDPSQWAKLMKNISNLNENDDPIYI